MVFELSSDTLQRLLQTERMIARDLGHELDMTSENLVSDFFELCGMCKDRHIALQADQIWAGLVKLNRDGDKSKFLNQYRSRMKDAIARQQQTLAA